MTANLFIYANDRYGKDNHGHTQTNAIEFFKNFTTKIIFVCC